MFNVQPDDIKTRNIIHEVVNKLSNNSDPVLRFIDSYDIKPKLSLQDQRRLYLSKYRKLEKSYQITFPGSKYIGPGTHVIDNVLSDKFPTTKTDAVAMLHDIDYLINAGKSQLYSDVKAVFNADPTTLQGIAMIVGLTTKNLIGFNKEVKYEGLTDVHTRNVGSVLLDYVNNDPLYTNILTEYNLKPIEQTNIDNLKFID
jgi:hypothetical protein